MSVFPDRSSKTTLPNTVSAIKSALAFTKTEGYLVGGVVRDSLLGIDTSDIDIAVEGNTTKIGKELAAFLNGTFVQLDVDREISRVVVQGDKSFQIDLVSIKNGINSNLKNRDFTINAMAVPISRLTENSGATTFNHNDLIDPNNGALALKNRELRAVSPLSLIHI